MDTTKHESNIQCIEVLISRKAIANNGHNLLWTLSVYSLENQPVRKSRSTQNSEIFHFMVYDWKRTIKQLLENHQVPYSIIQYFTPNSIYSDVVSAECSPSEKGKEFSLPFNFFPDEKHSQILNAVSVSRVKEDLVIEEKES